MAAPAALNSTVVAPRSPAASPRVRLDSVDLLRGVVMVIMALDHVRDFFTSTRFDPTDLSRTSAAIFATRWITHFCAPVFVFLAGTGAFLYQARGRSRAEVSWFLVTRGLWLVLLELTLVRLAWTFNFDYAHALFVQVIWVIGVSMVVLAGLIHLPLPAMGAIGGIMVLGHNLFDGLRPQALGTWGPLWTILHVQGPIPVGGAQLLVAYPLIPWIGVMALGYAFGPVLLLPGHQRRRLLLGIGAGLTLAFLALRAWNGYGDPSRWSHQQTDGFTALSFLNTTKYPPSLLYLFMTLGPAIMALVLFERASGPVARFLIVFGRVPLFFYVLHLFLIHALMILMASLAGFSLPTLLRDWRYTPDGWGYGLGVVYLIWAGVVLSLYPLCRWFAALKARRRDPWLSYL